jgi:hypothetical protein
MSKFLDYEGLQTYHGNLIDRLTYLVDTNEKNVLQFDSIGKASSGKYGRTYVGNGVTWTLNDDYSITAVRTTAGSSRDDDSSCNLIISADSLYVDKYCNGEYIFTGCPEGGTPDRTDGGYRVRILASSPDYETYRKIDTGEGVVLDNLPEGYSNVIVSMLVSYSYVGTVTFKPMLCNILAYKISPKYIPSNQYAANILKNENALVQIVDNGAKNILQIGTAVTVSDNGVTAVTNTDGSITLSGASSSDSEFVLINDLYSGSTSSSYSSEIPIKSGDYIIKATGDVGVRIRAINYNSSSDATTISASDADVKFTASKSYIVFQLIIRPDADFTTPITIYPMCCDSSLYALSYDYQPYKPSYDDTVKQVETNKNAIEGQQNTLADGGNGYAIVNGIRLYVSSTAPTGDIPDGSVGVGW